MDIDYREALISIEPELDSSTGAYHLDSGLDSVLIYGILIPLGFGALMTISIFIYRKIKNCNNNSVAPVIVELSQIN